MQDYIAKRTYVHYLNAQLNTFLAVSHGSS